MLVYVGRQNATYGEFEAYWCYIDKAVKVGDKVTVTGKITKYVSKDNKVTIEIKNGQAKLVSGTSGGGETGKGIEIKGLSTVMAYYYEDQTEDGYDFFWDFDMAADNEDYIPRVYFSCYNSALSATSIVGDWEIFYCTYVKAAGDTIYSDEDDDESILSITYKGNGTYLFKGEMLGEDGNTYVWTIETNDVMAIHDDEGEIIILEEDETPIKEVKYTKTIIKKIENGQVTIVRDDIHYNVQGIRTK